MLISLSICRFKHSLYGLGLSDVLGKFFFFLRIRVKHFLALPVNTHLLRLALCYFFSYYCFFSFFLFFLCMARWLALCPNSIYWMSQLFNILRQLLSQPGIWNGVCHGNPKSISRSVLKS